MDYENEKLVIRIKQEYTYKKFSFFDWILFAIFMFDVGSCVQNGQFANFVECLPCTINEMNL